MHTNNDGAALPCVNVCIELEAPFICNRLSDERYLPRLPITSDVLCSIYRKECEMTKSERHAEAQRKYRERMRDSGKREVIVWATPAQARAIRNIVKSTKMDKS